MATWIVGGAVLLIVAAILWRMIQKKRSGKGGCSGSCGHCSGCH